MIILEPPAPPVTSLTFPSLSVTIVGDIEDRGRFPGSIQLFWLEGAVHASSVQLGLFGLEKSSISSLNIMPVLLPIRLDPQLQVGGDNCQYEDIARWDDKLNFLPQIHLLINYFLWEMSV